MPLIALDCPANLGYISRRDSGGGIRPHPPACTRSPRRPPPQVWDYQLLSESLLGKTVIDLEDRYFSETWKTKQQNDALPKEMRPLTNPGNTNAQVRWSAT